MTKQEIIEQVKAHPAGKVKIAYADMDGILRGKYVSTEKFLSALDKATSFCDVIMGWDSADVLYDKPGVTGWHSGYPDSPARIDATTYRRIPWENDLPFFLGQLDAPGGGASPGCSRQLLHKMAKDAEDLGMQPIFAQEFEWFNFAETPQSAHQKNFQNLQPLTPGMFGYSVLRTTLRNDFFSSLFEELCKFGIPIEGLHTETGPGTYEAAITYGDVREAGDRAVLFKTAVKEIAYRHGVMATFMAKINENLPGCGGHIHQSLWDKKSGTNLFHDAGDPEKLSKTARSYIAGQLHCLPEILPMVAPTINSYKRLVEGAWAPTTLTWGVDNRTTALRVLNGSAAATRLETRVVGADVNPYLAMAACLGAGLYGIRHHLELQVPITRGNGYLESGKGSLPRTLIEATRAMEGSAIAREIFGEAFVHQFTLSRDWEWRQHLRSVTDWEYKRYFEII